MSIVVAFTLGFVFSFIGSIPPGSLNLIVFQLGLNKQIEVAIRFTIAVAIVEYPYAWISVIFADMVTSSPVIIANMKLITAVAITIFAVITLLPAKQQASPLVQGFNKSGFRRGVVLSILNPQAIPFWIVATAYLKEKWSLTVSTAWELHAYLLGISLGTVALLLIFTYFAQKIVVRFGDPGKLKKIPGYMLLALGLYGFVDYFFLS
ncbi:LysE family transporter [Pseudochryseolinea flava]|uniref:Lysine transporter LysE n=1 Tax=Pseudochryseolinea flava TaxID=2059302 RepID=A0A364Y9L2_9BACT|nr:LysE family transporter [Pseudochryseolinea flava]RAW03059.1 hypothetical protein DQQ10_02880 [Pseudochryseolinea flava]